MTIAKAEKLLATIAKEAERGDDEAAHALEDDLREMVLQAIATGRTNEPDRLAAIALRSSNLKFRRWFA